MAYTHDDWKNNFKLNKLFKGLIPLYDENNIDITDEMLLSLLEIAEGILPQGLVSYFSDAEMIQILNWTVAHLLDYYDFKNDYSETKTLIRNASSKSADGLSKSYQDIAKMKGGEEGMFPSLNDFLNTTGYGRLVCPYLERMAGSVGGFVV